MNTATTCLNGHENVEGQRFCGTCGDPLAPEASLPAQPPQQPLRAEAEGSTLAEPETKRHNRRPLIVGVIAAVLVSALGGVLFFTVGSGSTPSHVVHGTVLLMDSGDPTLGIDPSITESGGHCYGTGGYSDMAQGASVTVRDGSGHILATSNLGTGTGGAVASFAGLCKFTFSAEVPETNFYSVEVANRGQLNFSLAEMKKNNWHVDLSLGGS